jgi:signal transduction histidine kinase/DNA-binding response OmpR family regulator
LEIEIYETTSASEGLVLVTEHDFAVAIVDVQMPEMDGYEMVSLLRGNQRTASLPVIFVSAIYSDEYNHRKAYGAGAVDFLSKPFVPEILVSKVQVFIDLYEKRRELEQANKKLNKANRMLERRTQLLETGRQVGYQITSILRLEALLEEVVTLIQRQFEYAFIGVWLWQSEQAVLRLAAATGSFILPHTIVPQTVRGPLIEVVETLEPLYDVATTAVSETQLPQYPNTAVARLFPLRLGTTTLIGVLDVRQKPRQPFDEENLIGLQLLADQLAIAIRNAQLYDQILSFNEELEGKVRERTEQLEQVVDRLAQLDRSKSDFIEVVAHELRTPLSLVKGYSEMLQGEEGIKSNELYALQVRGIVSGAARMLEIVNTMLDMIKIDTQLMQLSPHIMSLSTLFRTLQSEFAPIVAERNQTLSVRDLENLPFIEADEEALFKLFYQLLINAVKYTPDGGSIEVSGRFHGRDQDTLTERAIQISIQDSGIGIDPQYHQLIFDKFYQTGQVSLHSTGKTKFKGGGPGLGLALAQGIVKAHGGHIWVESPGHDEYNYPGSTFYVLLPLRLSQVINV